ncbi:unnamed protein product [Camellia sinensis]
MESDPPFQENCKTLFSNFIEEQNPENPFTAYDEYELPLVDLSRSGLSDHDRKECERDLAMAAKQCGLFQVVNHGVSWEILAKLKSEQEKLFRQPFEKKVNKFLNCYRWGSPAATSLMQFSWSEAFHIPLENIPVLKEFNTSLSTTTIAVFAEVASELAKRIAEILAENLGSKTTFFAKNCMASSCYLRMNRYPRCPISSEFYGLVPHTDSDFLTILCQDQVGGLQMVKDGKWVSIKPNPQALIVIIGDLFQAWSNGVYKSIEHRVISNHEEERFSVGYFLCPSNDTVIQGCNENEPCMYRKFSFREYRQQVQEDVKSTGTKVGLSRFLM